MQFTVDAKTLTAELDAVRKTVNNKTSIPVLANVHIMASAADEITIIGTDLDQSIIATVPAEVAEIGAACLNAKALSDMTKPLTGAVTFRPGKKENRFDVICGPVEITLAATPADRFPLIPDAAGEQSATLKTERLQKMVKDTSFAVTKEMSRFTLNAAKFELIDAHLRVIATDGHRLAYADSNTVQGPLSWPRESGVLIRTEALKLMPILTGELATITEKGDHVQFASDNRRIITRKMSGKFPNYDMVLPKDHERAATFNMKEFAGAVKRSSTAASTTSKCINIEFGPADAATIEAAADEDCIRREAFPVGYLASDGPQTLGFNWQYVADFLNTVKAEMGAIKFTDSRVPAEFVPSHYDYELRYIVMPLRA